MIRVAILAFDGVVADTFPLRAYALAEAIAAECVPVTAADVLPYLPGRSLREAAIEAIHRVPVLQQPRFRDDVTLHDLVALRAQRSWSAAAAQGVPLQPGVMAAVPLQLARGRRLVLRSDSQRREVELLLQLAGLEDSVLFVRCADDAPRVMGATSLEASHRAIAARLDAQRIGRDERVAVEYDAHSAAQAAPFVHASSAILQEAWLTG